MVTLAMKITDKEIEWLGFHFPNLQYEADSQKIAGELNFCAAYDNESGEVIVGESARQEDCFIRDVFEIKIDLKTFDANGWPKVYEADGRYRQIAKKWNLEIIDLHVSSDDGMCCLGIKRGNNRNFSIKHFLPELVIPFFYRLSYTEKFGIDASRNDLWGEYSHGEEGLGEYRSEISNFAEQNPRRNDPCPCGNGKKFKKCHIDDVESLKRSARIIVPE